MTTTEKLESIYSLAVENSSSEEYRYGGEWDEPIYKLMDLEYKNEILGWYVDEDNDLLVCVDKATFLRLTCDNQGRNIEVVPIDFYEFMKTFDEAWGREAFLETYSEAD